MADETPINPGWISAAELRKELEISESAFRYWLDQLKDTALMTNRKKGGGNTWYYWQEDVDNILKPAMEGKRRKRG